MQKPENINVILTQPVSDPTKPIPIILDPAVPLSFGVGSEAADLTLQDARVLDWVAVEEIKISYDDKESHLYYKLILLQLFLDFLTETR